MINAFHDPNNIKWINTTLFTLISKCEDSSNIIWFRLIAFYNLIYKIFIKIISQRLITILPRVISYSFFLVWSLIIKETLSLICAILIRFSFFKKISIPCQTWMEKKSYMILKLDLEKAYDIFDWNFNEDSLNNLQVPSWICHIIKACISPATIFVN